MALDQLLIQPLDDGTAAPSPFAQPVIPTAQPEPIPVSSAPVAVEPIAPAPPPPAEPMSWDSIWDQLGTAMPEPVRQAAGAVRSAIAPTSSTPAPTGEIDNSSRQSFVRSAFPHMLAATDGDRGLAEALLAIAISENGDVGKGGGFVGNNFAGIKGQGSAGSFTADTWEEEGGRRVPQKATFAAFTTPQEGFRAFGQFLQNNSRYHDALGHYRQTGDVNQLLGDINRAGYATDSNWASTIANIRENQVAPVVAGIAGGVPQPMPTAPRGAGLDIDSIAQRYAGGGYIFGGGRDGQGYGVPGDPNSDCSAFVSAVWAEQGIPLIAHTDAAYNQLRQLGASQVPSAEAQPGDVVFYMGEGAGGAVTHHMGIYAGNGKVLDQSTGTTSGVKIRDLNHAGKQIVVMRDPRMNGATPTTVLPPSITPTGRAEGAMQTGTNIPDGVAAPSMLEQLNRMTEYARQLAEQASGGARDVADRAIKAPLQAGMEWAAGAPVSSFNGDVEAGKRAVAQGLVDKAGIKSPWDVIGVGQQIGPWIAAPGYAAGREVNRYLVNTLAEKLGLASERPSQIEGAPSTIDPNLSTGQALRNTQVRGWTNAGVATLTGVAQAVREMGFEPIANQMDVLANQGRNFLHNNPDAMRRSTKDAFSSPFGIVEGIAESVPSILPTVLGSALATAGIFLKNPGLAMAGGRMAQAGLVLGGTQAYGSQLDELRGEVAAGRMTEQTANAVALGAGLIEVAVERLFPGIDKKLIDGIAEDAARKMTQELVRRGIVRTVGTIAKETGQEMLQEGVEEAISEAYGVGAEYAFAKNKPSLLEAVRRIGNAAVIGSASGGLMAAPTVTARTVAENLASPSSLVAPGATQPAQVPQNTSSVPPDAPEPAVAQQPPVGGLNPEGVTELTMEPVARPRPNEGPGLADEARFAQPLPPHRIGDIAQNRFETEGALALDPVRSNMVADPAEVWTYEDTEAAFDRGERPPQEAIDRNYDRYTHGTNRAFDQILPSTEGALGAGVYLSPMSDEVPGSQAFSRGFGGNIRPVLVPKSFNLLGHGDGKLSPAQQRQFLARLSDDERRSLQPVIDQLARSFTSRITNASVHAGDFFSRANKFIDGDRIAEVLSGMGFDGIYGTGLVGTVIFPQSQDKLRNGFAGTRGGMQAAVQEQSEDRVIGGKWRLVGGQFRTGDESSALIEGSAVIPNTQVSIRGQRGETPQQLLDDLAKRPYMRSLADIGQSLVTLAQLVAKARMSLPERQHPSRFGELLVGAPNLLGSTERHPDNSPDTIAITPHEIWHDVLIRADGLGREVGSEQFHRILARRLLGIVAHETIHPRRKSTGNASHDAAFERDATVLTTHMVTAVPAVGWGGVQTLVAQLQEMFDPATLQQLHADYERLREGAKSGAATSGPRAVGGPGGDLGGNDLSGPIPGGAGSGTGLSPSDLRTGPGGPESSLARRPDHQPVRTPDPARVHGLRSVPDEADDNPLEDVGDLIQQLHDASAPVTGDVNDARQLREELRAALLDLDDDQIQEALEIAAANFYALKDEGNKNKKGFKPTGISTIDGFANGSLRALITPLIAKHEHGSTQVDIEGPLAARILVAARNAIRTAERAGSGLEDEPHVTVRFGLSDQATVDEVEARIAHLPPINARIGEVRSFPGRNGDPAVIYLSIEGDLAPLHEALEDLDAEGFEQFESYTPHLTLGYARPDAVKAILARANSMPSIKALIGTSLPVSQVSVSDRYGNKDVVELSGTPAVVEPEAEPEIVAPSAFEPEPTPEPEPATLAGDELADEDSPDETDLATIEDEVPEVDEEPQISRRELKAEVLGSIAGLGAFAMPENTDPKLVDDLVKAAQEWKQDTFTHDEITALALSRGYDPKEAEAYDQNLDTLIGRYLSTNTVDPSVDVRALKTAWLQYISKVNADIRAIGSKVKAGEMTPEDGSAASDALRAMAATSQLGRATRRAGEMYGRALGQMAWAAHSAAEVAAYERYRLLAKEAGVASEAAGRIERATAGGQEPAAADLRTLDQFAQMVQVLISKKAFPDLHLKIGDGPQKFIWISEATPEQLEQASPEMIVRAMNARYERDRVARTKAEQDANRSAMAAGAQDDPSPAYLLGENLVREQEAHGDDVERERLADEREDIIRKIVQETLDEELKKITEAQQKGGLGPSPEEIMVAVYEALGERDAAQARSEAINRARAGETIGPVAREIRDIRNTENQVLAAAEAAAAHLARGLGRLEQKLGTGVMQNAVLEAIRAKVEAEVADLALHPGSQDAVGRVYAAYQKAADGDGQRLVDAALRVIGRERYIGDTRVDPDQVAAVSETGVRRTVQRAVSGVLEKPADANARTSLQRVLTSLRGTRFGEVGVRLADDLVTLVAMEDARRIANEAIDEAKLAPNDPAATQVARDMIDKVRDLAETTSEPWLYQRFAAMAYTLDERLDVGVERAFEKLAGQAARDLARKVLADPSDPVLRKLLQDAVAESDPEQSAELLARLDASLRPTVRDQAAVAGDATRTDASRQGGLDALLGRLDQFTRVDAANRGAALGAIKDLRAIITGLGPEALKQANDRRDVLITKGLDSIARRRDAQQGVQRAHLLLGLYDPAHPETFGKALRLLANPSWANLYREIGVIAMLSSPTTWGPLGINSISTGWNAALDAAQFFPLLGYDAAAAAMNPKRGREVFLEEFGTSWREFWKALPQARSEASSIMRTGYPIDRTNQAVMSGEIRDVRPELGSASDNPVAAKLFQLGHVFSTRPLAALDTLWSVTLLAARAQALRQRLALRDGVPVASIDLRDHPEIIEKAGKLTDYTLFQERRPEVTQMLNRWRALLGEEDPDAGWIKQFFQMLEHTLIPFKGIPINQILQNLSRSAVAAPVHAYKALAADTSDRAAAKQAAAELSEKRGDIITADDVLLRGEVAYRDIRSGRRVERGEHVARMAVALGLATIAIPMALAGNLTGSEPDDPEERDEWAQKRLKPYHIWLPTQGWVPYLNTPFTIPFAMWADFGSAYKVQQRKLQQSDPDPRNRSTLKDAGQASMAGVNAMGPGILKAIGSNFFLETAASLFGNIYRGDVGKAGLDLTSDTVNRHIPAFAAYIRNLIDNTTRDATREDSWGGTIRDRALNRIPGASFTLPAATTNMGRERPGRFSEDSGLPGITSIPDRMNPRASSTIDILGQYDLHVPAPPEQPAISGGLPIRLTEREQTIYKQALGAVLPDLVVQTYNDPAFVEMPEPDPDVPIPAEALRHYAQKKSLQAAINGAKQQALGAVVMAYGDSDDDRTEILRRLMYDEFVRDHQPSR